MTLASAPRDELVALLPSLRAFALSLAGTRDKADDLVQDTVCRALGNLHMFQPGTSMSAWLFTIAKNSFYSLHRKRRREVEDPDEKLAMAMVTPPTQNIDVMFADFLRALNSIAPHQREALYLVEVLGLSFEEAAAIMGTPLNTAKSRTIRARANLVALLAPDGDRQSVMGSTYFA